MYRLNQLFIKDIVVEHRTTPLGIDIDSPRFGWKLDTDTPDTMQTAYQIQLRANGIVVADTGKIDSCESTEICISDFHTMPITRYLIALTIWDNHTRSAYAESWFETGLLGLEFVSRWIEPEQNPTPSSMDEARNKDGVAMTELYIDGERDFHEFRPSQYIRIPFNVKKGIRAARIYATAHGIYKLEVNGQIPDDREFSPENTAYHHLLQYQTYDITAALREGENVIGVILADGWWIGRVGTTGDCCQYGDTLGLLMDISVEYTDGSREIFTGETGVSSPGPILFSDLFVGEKYDANLEMPGWSTASFDAAGWRPVLIKDYTKDNIVGQYDAPVRIYTTIEPQEIFRTPNGDVILDAGQVVAGILEFHLTTNAGHTIKLEHTEVMGNDGNYFNNILNINKEQTEIYITREGYQSYRPSFTYHGFRYVRIQGWPGEMSLHNFKILVFSSEMAKLSSFKTSDERLNQLESNIWWSQIANTISIPTDCPQREKAGWTGDIMAFSPTLCFQRDADAFLTSWMNNVRAEQLNNGAIPMIVPYLKAYATFLKGNLGTDTSCGWGDACIIVPYAVYKAYGDRQILEDNYEMMTRWMAYIDDRAKNNHPEEYDSWDTHRKENSRYLWNTDFHFGDWLIPSIVLGNSDAMAMNETAYATMGIVAPAYYAFSARSMSKIASILGKSEDAAYYDDLYKRIREAFIEEYVHEDGTMDADFQGIYVISLQIGLVPEETRPKMVSHLCEMIEENNNCLDTGFLSVLFLMDVLCDNGRKDMAYKLLFQTACPSWLYKVNAGGTTMWESWGAIGENGEVSTYSYNHYAFGCVADWIYRQIGGLKILEAGYRRFEVSPDFDCGLSHARLKKETPYGKIIIAWKRFENHAVTHVEVPANSKARICLPGMEEILVGSGKFDYITTL